ncbi:hypothetical protein DFH08DRAFT_999775 [Mycena albidolilacea]|uniref:Uncharacterized protein n=1 Tax=Mycena albidolilacea TaxID=1033008 RepID=A0AAD7E697_9AGAR|nr:hypothetical protein DFH08DRAFT_999775 [Mycena albidolilacea]
MYSHRSAYRTEPKINRMRRRGLIWVDFIDDEPLHEGSHFLIPEETNADAAALEALAASFKAAPESSLDAPAAASSGYEDSVLRLFQPDAPEPSVKTARVQRGEWIRLNKKPYERKIAWVVSSRRFIVANLTTSDEEDSCSRLSYDTRLLASEYPRVVPSHDELRPFQRTREEYLEKATFIGIASALVEGVRVVVVEGKHKGYVGYIVSIREIPHGKHLARWAKVQEEYNGTDDVEAKIPGIAAQVLHLRRHALDPPTPFRVLDRVQVVTGIEHRGAIGRIAQVDKEWLRVQCLHESGEQNIIEIEHRRATRYFMQGDFVCVTSGSTDRRGLVVKVCAGGALELYSVKPRKWDGWDDDPTWRAPSRDVNFDLRPESAMSSWAALVSQPDPRQTLRPAMGHDLKEQRREGKHDGSDFEDALRLAVDEDIKKQRRLREGRPVGRRFEGVDVQVVRPGPFKWTRGIVVGDFDGPDRAKRIERCKGKYPVRDDEGIMVTVQKEGSNERFTVGIERLAHIHTLLPLSKTQGVPDWLLAREPTPEPGRALTPLPPSRSPTPPAQASSTSNSQVLDGDFGATAMFRVFTYCVFSGELDGRWLCIPGLAHKRVDVVLKDIARSENRYFRPKKRILSCEGRAGYLALDEPFRQEDLDKKTIRVWAVGPNGTSHPVRGPCIRPIRHMGDGAPISQVVTRVVVIGCDAAGDVSRLGCYGEARPHDGQVSDVKFEDLGTGLFHLSSLCRSLNVETQSEGGVLGVTVFH